MRRSEKNTGILRNIGPDDVSHVSTSLPRCYRESIANSIRELRVEFSNTSRSMGTVLHQDKAIDWTIEFANNRPYIAVG